jgi:hypothetical protein
MRRIIIAAAALALAGCETPQIPASPADAANQTILDERAALGAELAYKAARTAVEVAVDAGIIKGEGAARVAAYDNRAYSALQSARAAYRTANASSYAAALTEAHAAISDMIKLLGGAR